MKISVIMVDGCFRENVFAANYFSKQNFPDEEYEIIWVDYYDRVNDEVDKIDKVRKIALGKSGEYHSSFCFNEGIKQAKGEVLVIPDADVVVEEDFLQRVWDIHQKDSELVCYVRRYDEQENNRMVELSFNELKEKCILVNPTNYGGCLTVRKKWMLKINGYEMHPVFSGGFHANGLDIYTRLMNYGLAIKWSRDLKLYHPWHMNTAVNSTNYVPQKAFIENRKILLEYLAHLGIDNQMNLSSDSYEMLYHNLPASPKNKKASLAKKLIKKLKA